MGIELLCNLRDSENNYPQSQYPRDLEPPPIENVPFTLCESRHYPLAWNPFMATELQEIHQAVQENKFHVP